MPKVLLFRASDELNARLMAELSRAGYDAATPEHADVQTVLEHAPDLILLHTDVATLDCCGLLTQLKGNEGTSFVKIILLAHGGPLERSRALDLGADDVVSIPFESAELFARIRAQLREKAPDDRLRAEAREAKRKELEAEAALATVVGQNQTGKRRWMGLWLVIAVVAIAVVIVVSNSQVTRKSNAKLALQLEKLHSDVITENRLLERAQKSRELLAKQETDSVSKQIEQMRSDSTDLRTRMASSSGWTLTDLDKRLKETDLRIGKLESESRIAQQNVENYTESICLIYVVLGFHDKSSGASLKFAGVDVSGGPLLDANGNPLVTTEGDGRPVHLHVFGTGFLVDTSGHILTNHHVLQPWWHNSELPVPEGFDAHLISVQAFFPGSDVPLPLRAEGFSEDFDLGIASVSLPKKNTHPV